jgi:RNA-binding protein YlmH
LHIPEVNSQQILEGAIYNLTGQMVYNFNSDKVYPGSNTIKINRNKFKDGIYIGLIRVNDKTIKQKFTYTK